MVTEVTCAIIIDGSRVLLTQRSESMSHPLQWEFPGGKMRQGETPESCIKREIMEELNLRISVEQLLPSVWHDYGNKVVKLIPFICSLDSKKLILNQHRDYSWVKKKEFRKYDLLEADKRVVQMLNVFWK
ncbi:MAG: (deoxy)nucleoside triphosphate pyrophosphohydrolase [Bacteroidales bacterium]|nr:(deoxy)nucleoside triphosphate pyrophosphohydrolase [Bacteroidales bacterium]